MGRSASILEKDWRAWSHPQGTSQAFKIVKTGQKMFLESLVQATSTFLESPRSVRSLLTCSLRAMPLEDLQQHHLWRNANPCPCPALIRGPSSPTAATSSSVS